VAKKILNRLRDLFTQSDACIKLLMASSKRCISSTLPTLIRNHFEDGQFGRGVDTLTLARNARTSPEMIDRFYAAPLQGEMNVGELQSKRRPRPWEY
jgi:hypothetical protein